VIYIRYQDTVVTVLCHQVETFAKEKLQAMATTETLGNGGTGTSSAGNNKVSAAHFQAAAKHHREAATHCEAGNHEQAVLDTLIAQRHIGLAHQAEAEERGEAYTNEYGDPNFVYRPDQRFIYKESNNEDYHFFTH
jgi:hypothetical protein